MQYIKNMLEERGSGIDFTRSKLTMVISKNCRYSKLIKIDSIINGETNECDKNDELSFEDLTSFKHAPVFLCDVERSFSNYKSML